jgi:hypothetical protein
MLRLFWRTASTILFFCWVLNFILYSQMAWKLFASLFIAPKRHTCNIKDRNYVLNIGEIMLISAGNISYLDTINALVGLGLLIHEVCYSRSHTTTHHSR